MTAATTLEEVNAELTLRLRQQELAVELANFGLCSDELQAVLDETCRVAAKGMECSFAKVLEYQPETGRFLVRAGTGWRPGVVGHATLGGDTESPAGFAFQTGQPVLSNQLATETRFRTPALLQEYGIHRAFNVLVHTQEWRYGVLEVDSPDQRDFSLSDTAFLQALAATLANAIAKQRRLEEQRRGKAFVQSVLDASPDCLKVLDGAGHVELINANGLALLGLSDVGQVAGRPWADLWPEDQRDRVRAALAAARDGRTERFEGFGPTPGGHEKWWDVVVAPIEAPDGRGGRCVAISRDITERMAAQHVRDLLMLEVHHRVKNSLQLVQNLLSLQARASGNEAASGLLLESAARVRTIAAIHDRLYQTGGELSVDVGLYLEGLVQDLRASGGSQVHGRAIEIEADRATWPAADMPTLGIILNELVTNALKYGAGTVHVQFQHPPGSNGTLAVWDEGTGLPADFDPARSRGLGMRLITGLLRGEGARLEIDRRDGRTCFVAHLPASRAAR